LQRKFERFASLVARPAWGPRSSPARTPWARLSNATHRWFGAPWPRTHLRPGDPSASVPPRQTDALEPGCPAPKLGAAADLGAQLKGDAVTHRNPSTLRKRAARSLVPDAELDRILRSFCRYILRLRRLRSFSAVAARSEAGARQANLPNGGSRSTLAEAPTKGENVQSQRRVPTRRDHSDAEPTVDVESDEALVSGDAVEWALVLA